MGALDGISAALQGAVDWTFGDAMLVAAGAGTVNSIGAVTYAAANNACRARVNQRRTIGADGGAIIVTEIMILVGSLSVEPQPGNTVTGLDRTYKLGAIRRDGIASHWVCEVVNG